MPHVAADTPGRGDVGLEHVVHHHPVGAETPAEGANGPLHPGDPPAWQTVLIQLVIQGDDLVAEHPEERLAVAHVMDTGRGVRFAAADGETVLAVISLGPPSVENREVQPAVEHDLFTARAARL